jgi:hypothetical protein
MLFEREAGGMRSTMQKVAVAWGTAKVTGKATLDDA